MHELFQMRIGIDGMNFNWWALLTQTTKTHCSGRMFSYAGYSINFFNRNAFMPTVEYIKRNTCA